MKKTTTLFFILLTLSAFCVKGMSQTLSGGSTVTAPGGTTPLSGNNQYKPSKKSQMGLMPKGANLDSAAESKPPVNQGGEPASPALQTLQSIHDNRNSG